jgi:ABC-type transport system involved in cytochrome bd biosynthesis fused ATPase/permease subunit
MILNETDQEIFDSIVKKFTDKYGEDVLKDVYKMNRELDNKLKLKAFPIAHIFKTLLCRDLKTKYKGMSMEAIAKEEGVGRSTIYNYLKIIYKAKGGKSKIHTSQVQINN